MSRASELTPISQPLVEGNARLHRDGDIPAAHRLELMVRLREALRDLCVAAGALEPEMEQSHVADMASLRKLSQGKLATIGT
jgi:hypothetical protein